MKTLRLLFLLFLALQTEIYAQNDVILRGKQIDIKIIPSEAGLILNSDLGFNKNGREYFVRKAFTPSDNKNFILVHSIEKSDLDNEIDPSQFSLIEMYNTNKQLLWSKEVKGKTPISTYISKKGDITHIHWYSNEEDDPLSELVTYDSKGNIIYSSEDTKFISTNSDANLLAYSRKNNEDMNKLYLISIQNNFATERVITFSGNPAIRDISENGNNVVVYASESVYSYNRLGEMLWKKDFGKYAGLFIINDNGSKVARIKGFGKHEVYDNKTGEMINTFNYSEVEGYKLMEQYGCFISNSDLFVTATGIKSHTLMLVIFNLNGDILNSSIITTESTITTMDAELKDNRIFVFLNRKNVINIALN